MNAAICVGVSSAPLTNVRDLPPLAWLDANASLQVLRILQEALTNVVKHAQASRIRVETAFDDDSVVVRVTDNGRGLPEATSGVGSQTGRGLQNMRRRAESLGGRIAITRESGETHVSLRLPRERRIGQ